MIGKLERVIEKKPEQKIEVDKDIITSLKKAEKVLSEESELEWDRKWEKEQELIYGFNHRHPYEDINESKVPTDLEFYCGGENKNVFKVSFLPRILKKSTKKFIGFITSEIAEEFCFQNKLPTNIEIGNIYYEILNTNESIYDFLLQKQDKTKQMPMRDLALMIPFQITLSSFLTTSILTSLTDLIC